MTNQIKNFIENVENEFEEKFGKFNFSINIKNWHKQRQISLIKMIVEIVESEIDRNIKIDKMQDGLKTENKVDTSVFLETLKDTISSKLKEIINTPSL
jgi:predicted sugar kinase